MVGAAGHFIDGHKTTEQNRASRFVCSTCLLPGFGVRHICDICDLTSLHASCQKSLKSSGTVTCPFYTCSNDEHSMTYKVSSTTSRCHVCAEPIPGGYFECNVSGGGIRAHPTCRLFQSRDTGPDFLDEFNHCGRGMRDFNLGNRYTCITCGSSGFGRRFACKVCTLVQHPYCIKSSTRDKWSKTCFLHADENCMCWETEARQEGKSPCEICLQKIRGSHYRCVATDAAVHPLCVKLMDLDNKYHAKREMAEQFATEFVKGFVKGALFTFFGSPS